MDMRYHVHMLDFVGMHAHLLAQQVCMQQTFTEEILFLLSNLKAAVPFFRLNTRTTDKDVLFVLDHCHCKFSRCIVEIAIAASPLCKSLLFLQGSPEVDGGKFVVGAIIPGTNDKANPEDVLVVVCRCACQNLYYVYAVCITPAHWTP